MEPMADFELVWNDETLKPEEFDGFFVGWENPPPPEVAHKVFMNASEYCLARVDGKLAGFITVFTDGFYIAYIPLLEVRPEFQRRGIGKALVRAAVERYKDYYKLDVLCDLRSVLFYQQLGFQWVSGATLVNYERQSTGRP